MKQKSAKFKFRRKYSFGEAYAALVKGRKLVGFFGRDSQVTKHTVTLFSRDKWGELKKVAVPHSAIINDPWAVVTTIPREEPPKCVLPVPENPLDARYRRGGQQNPQKGKKIRAAKPKYQLAR